MNADEFLAIDDSFRVSLRKEILDAVLHHERHRPRSVQTALGPSEAGSPCARRLAYGLTGTRHKGCNQYTEVLPSMIGTAMHAQMEKVMELQNQILGYERYKIEIKVKEPIAGTCDLYDSDLFTIVDWKFLGKSTYDKYTKHGPSQEYRRQVHLYGLGVENLGMKVENVSIMMFSRQTKLRDAHLWLEPYDRQLALDTAARLVQIGKLSNSLDTEAFPYRFRFIPATPGDCCYFCNWFNPAADGSNPWECPGTGSDPNVALAEWREQNEVGKPDPAADGQAGT